MLQKIFARILLLGIVFVQITFTSFISPITVAAESGQSIPYVVISAVQITGGTGHTQEDYVEIYNPTPTPYDLKDHRLVKRTAASTTDTLIKSWTESTVIQPYHFYLWANSSFTTIASTPDVTSSGTLADNNGIALRLGANDIGAVVDALSWGSTANGFENPNLSNPSTNQSIVLSNPLETPDHYEIKSSGPRNSSVSLAPVIKEEVPQDVPQEPPVVIPQPETSPVEVPPLEVPPVESPSVETPPATATNPPSETQSEVPTEEPEVAEPNSPASIKITELLPNPTGTDSGLEKVELYNDGPEPEDLQGYILDDVAPTDPISTNAYTLPSLDIESGNYLSLTIPSGKFALNNTQGDIVTLFNPSSVPMDSVSYLDTTPEGKSYAKYDSEWAWGDPSLGNANGTKPEQATPTEDEIVKEAPAATDYNNSALQITELYPNPDSNEKEFIEIYNSGEETAELAVVSLWVGDKHKNLPDQSLAPGEYYVVKQSEEPAQLRNTGQVIMLKESETEIDKVTYATAAKGQSFARFEDGFLWTTSVTPDKENILTLPEVVLKTAPVIAKTVAKEMAVAKASVKTKTAAKKPASKVTPKANPKSSTAIKPVDKQVSTEPNSEITPEEKSTAKFKEDLGKIIAMGAAAVIAGVVALYKLVFSAGIE